MYTAYLNLKFKHYQVKLIEEKSSDTMFFFVVLGACVGYYAIYKLYTICMRTNYSCKFRKQQGDVQVLTDANESPEVEQDLSDSVTPQNIDSNTDVQVLTDTNEPSEVEQDPSDSVSKKHKNHHLQLLINRFIHFVYYYNHLIQ